MGNMDHLANDSWSTVSTVSPLPLHQSADGPAAVPVPSTPARIREKPKSLSHGPIGKQPFAAMELEGTPSWSERSWMKRIRWFRNTRTHRDSFSSTPNGEAAPYVGGEMESAPPMPSAPTETALKPRLARPSTFHRITSWMTATSSQHDEESVLDFQESEWTPPDSSYGAAIPVFGWVPKTTRRYIEFLLMLLLIAGLVYLVVTISFIISEARHDNSINNGGTLDFLDDDRYVDYTDDTTSGQQQQYDDPYR
jgi:hypothetical protein